MPATVAPTGLFGTGTAPGTCGELAQGTLAGGRRFHVTCPIDLGSSATVQVRPAERTTVTVLSPGAWKTEQALGLAASRLGLGAVAIDVTLETTLLPAKGMASSTADIVAAVRALAAAAGVRLPAEELAAVAAAVEPTDGVMHAGVCVVDQGSGQVLRRWNWWPSFTIAMFSPPAGRDTATTDFDGQERDAAAYADLLAALDEAVAARDPYAFAAQATRSAWLNEAYVPSALLGALAAGMERVGAAGVCVGHSGTLGGLLFVGDDQGEGHSAAEPDRSAANARASAAVASLLPHLPPGTVGQVVRMPVPADEADEAGA